MVLIVNGKEYNLDTENIDELLKHFEVEPSSVVVEKNGLIVHKEDYSSGSLKDGDILEIVRFVGGG